MPARTDNIETLRHRIDSGETGEKVNHPDPAAAPLGADDEASGHPVSPTQVAQARAEEPTQTPEQPAPPADMRYYRADAETGSRLALSALALPIVLVLLIVFGAFWAFL